MQVSDVMTRDVQIISPDQSIREAALVMGEIDIGVLPVGEDDELVGMITDRDIAVRGVATGAGPETPVGNVMTPDVRYCFEDEDIAHVSRNMGDQQIRRIPVVNRNKRIVGILSIGDLAIVDSGGPVGEALQGIARPGGTHCQSAEGGV